MGYSAGSLTALVCILLSGHISIPICLSRQNAIASFCPRSAIPCPILAFCKNCGNQIEDNAATCPNCGASQNTTPQVTDNGGFLWGLLGCCIPIVGLVLFLVWKDTKPKTSKATGIGALVGVILMILYYILIAVVGVGFAAMGF